jgi:hypothetical protein
LKAVKSSGSKLFESRGIFLMEVSILVFGISEICCRFPRVRAFIAFLLNLILELSMEDIEIHDLVNLVLFFAFYYDRVRQWGFVKTIVLIESKSVDIEDRIEL